MTIRTWWARLKERFWDKEIEEIEHPQVAGFFVRTPPLRSGMGKHRKIAPAMPKVLAGCAGRCSVRHYHYPPAALGGSLARPPSPVSTPPALHATCPA